MPRGIKKTNVERMRESRMHERWLMNQKPLKSPCLEGRRKHRWIRVYKNKFKKFYVPLHTGSFKFDNDICSWCGKTRKQANKERKKK